MKSNNTTIHVKMFTVDILETIIAFFGLYRVWISGGRERSSRGYVEVARGDVWF